jgi:hypothetical protein
LNANQPPPFINPSRADLKPTTEFNSHENPEQVKRFTKLTA